MEKSYLHSTRVPSLLLLVAAVTAAIAGCGGSSSGAAKAGPANPFAGTFVGSDVTETLAGVVVSFSSDQVTIGSDGTISGSATSAAGTVSQVTGSVDSTGAATVVVGASSASGTLQFNSAGQLTGVLSNAKGTLSLRVNAPSSPLEFRGTFSGTFATTSGKSGTVPASTVTSAGSVSGTVSVNGGGVVTYDGTISNNGQFSVEYQSSGTFVKGICAFDGSGNLLIVTSDGTGGSATLKIAPASL